MSPRASILSFAAATLVGTAERLARMHPTLVEHRVYPQSGHAVVAVRPDWFLRDAIALLGPVRRS